MRIAAVQFEAGSDIDANVKRIGELVESAASAGADVVVLPEAAMHEFGAPDLPLGAVAQTLDGPFVSALASMARHHGLMLVAGMFEVSSDPARPYNTLVVLDSGGQVVATYRKIHLYDSFGFRESDRLLGGAIEPVVIPVGDLTLGLMTCYDVRFPEMGRMLVDAGADVLLVPAAWVSGPLKETHWATLLRARAIENTAYVVGAGQTGHACSGCSAIIDPLGVTMAELGDEEGVLTADLAAERLAAVRRRNPSLANRQLPRMR